jgi:hypothetical protein
MTLTREREWREGTGPRLAYASDGRAFASAGAQWMSLFEDDELIATEGSPRGLLGDLRFGPEDRSVLASPLAFDRAARAWEETPDLGEALFGDLPPEAAEGFAVHGGAWAPDGRALALYAEFRPRRGEGLADRYDGPKARLVVVDGRTGAREALLWEGGTSEPHRTVAITDDLVAAGGTVVDVWERPSGRPVAVLEDLGTLVRTLRLSGDGRRLAAGTADGTVAVWDTTTWRPAGRWKAHSGEAAGLGFYPGGHTLATGGDDGAVRLWSGDDGKLIGEAALEAPVEGLAFRPDGGRLLASQAGPGAAIVAFTLAG